MNTNTNGKGSAIDGAVMSVLTEHRHGEVITELTAALREVTHAVALVGKSGTVTLKIKVAPALGTSDTLVISDDIKTTIPKLAKAGTIFYPDDNDNLVRNDPNQYELPMAIRDIAQSAADRTRVVDIETAPPAKVKDVVPA